MLNTTKLECMTNQFRPWGCDGNRVAMRISLFHPFVINQLKQIENNAPSLNTLLVVTVPTWKLKSRSSMRSL